MEVINLNVADGGDKAYFKEAVSDELKERDNEYHRDEEDE